MSRSVHCAGSGIDSIVQGDESYPQPDENIVQIPATLRGVSAETGQILYDDAVDFSCVDIVHHLLKTGTFKIRATPAVIHIVIT